MTKREQITTLLTTAQAPGISATAIAQQLGMTLGAVMGHIKWIKRALTVQIEKQPNDRRSHYYRATHTKTVAAAPKKKKAQPMAKPTPLSAEQMEAAICATLRRHARPCHPMDMASIASSTKQAHALVRPAITALVQRGTVTRIKGGYHMAPPPKPAPVATSVAVARLHANSNQPNGSTEYWAAHVRAMNTPARVDVAA